MSNKKEQERAELHRTIWNIANDLRGSVDGWDFKQYVLGMLFYRYISENITSYINKGEHEAGIPDFDYANLSDEEAESAREDMVQTRGFFILPSELFINVKKRAGDDSNLNETLETIFKNIEASAQGTASERNFNGLFDDIDVNSNKLGSTVTRRNEKLVKLLNSVAEMNLGSYQDNSIDAFGDAYEYLMAMYASNVDEDWKAYLEESKEREIKALISEENLKEEETRRFVDNAFRDGIMRTTGTDIDRLMPPVSRFASNQRAIKKQTIIDKLLAFFERYFGLG